MIELNEFVRESNAIEGINRLPTWQEIDAHQAFLDCKTVTVGSLRALVAVLQPNATLRDRVGLDVRVGSYYPPRGGLEIRTLLEELLADVKARQRTPWAAHKQYESIHPFTDGNGRSGRALWLHMMSGRAPLGFLHMYYYQTLAEAR